VLFHLRHRHFSFRSQPLAFIGGLHPVLACGSLLQEKPITCRRRRALSARERLSIIIEDIATGQ
jgi:hypothetical protein